VGVPDSGEQRQFPRKRAAVSVELHFECAAAPTRVQTSDLSAGGCYIETMFPQPIGSKLNIVLWLGEARIQAAAVVVTCTPQFGNGLKFIEMAAANREQLTQFLESLPQS
jgi:c-di-GMP-binding flagellar brake protein YcgR